MKTTIVLLLTLAAFCTGPLFGGGFSKLPNSARAVAFGGSLVSLSDDPNVLFDNPAGIGGISSLALSTTYVQLFTGVQEDNLRYIAASGAANLGFFGQIGGGVRTFNSNFWKENEFTGTYAQTVFGFLSAGGSVRLLQWTSASPQGLLAVPEAGLSNAVLAFDAGVQTRLENIVRDNDLIIGLAVNNLNEPSIAKNGSRSGKLDRRVQAGLAYISHAYDYIISVHAERQGDLLRIGGGAEFVAAKGDVFSVPTAIMLRVGGGTGSASGNQSDLNGGIGLQVGSLRIDYAYQYYSLLQSLSGTHVISLNYAL